MVLILSGPHIIRHPAGNGTAIRPSGSSGAVHLPSLVMNASFHPGPPAYPSPEHRQPRPSSRPGSRSPGSDNLVLEDLPDRRLLHCHCHTVHQSFRPLGFFFLQLLHRQWMDREQCPPATRWHWHKCWYSWETPAEIVGHWTSRQS